VIRGSTGIKLIKGHCSVRDPVEPDTFWVNPQGKSFALMKQSDLVRLRVSDGVMVEGRAPTDASASSIHSQLYKIRGRGVESGIEAIVHVHGPHSKAFSTFGRELDMISQDACSFHDEMAIVPFGGESRGEFWNMDWTGLDWTGLDWTGLGADDKRGRIRQHGR